MLSRESKEVLLKSIVQSIPSFGMNVFLILGHFIRSWKGIWHPCGGVMILKVEVLSG